MVSELEGGSWSADLTSATLHLVRGEVHADLADLCTPAKLLQNAITANAGAASALRSGGGRRRRNRATVIPVTEP